MHTYILSKSEQVRDCYAGHAIKMHGEANVQLKGLKEKTKSPSATLGSVICRLGLQHLALPHQSNFSSLELSLPPLTLLFRYA